MGPPLADDQDNQINRIFREVLNRPPSERQAYLTTIVGQDPGVKAALEHLLASGSPPPSMQDGATVVNDPAAGPPPMPDAVSRLLETDDLSGCRFGPYELLERVGKGGMGYVYAAQRADQAYKKVVAVKLVKPGMETETIVQRFRLERQVLARLDHPNIARLLDGGTERGLPYLVMEFVQGTPLDQYCRVNRLSVADRLRLFLTVCSAVQFAHQNLVIHRDLKPSNILVTPEGVPKLLDFGIAKVLNPEPGDEQSMTRAFERPMTPDYASPEQVRGEPITTSSDVFALGIVLYELLTTEHPLRRSHARQGFPQFPVDMEPDRPSTVVTEIEPRSTGLPGERAQLSSLLRGDLDAIVLMALRSEPSRRYASVEHMADDIERHLQGLPVRAHRDSFRYRAAKFLRRNAAAVVAAAVVAVALVTSSIVSWLFYYEADRQRVRAEARFSDVRQLARFVLFDFDQIIRQGETPARKAVLEKATEYLDRLDKDRGGDPSIESELVQGYLKVGDVQGNLWGANLGDKKAALASYQRAVSVLDSSKTVNALQESQVRVKLADVLVSEGAFREAVEAYSKACSALRPTAATDAESRRNLTTFLGRLAFAQGQSGDQAGALASYGEMLTLAKISLADVPNSPELRKQVATAELRTGDARARAQGVDKGLPEMLHALSVYQELAAAAPESATAQRPVSYASGFIGDVLMLGNRYKEAAGYFRTALKVSEDLAARDVRNAQYTRDRITYLARLAEAEGKAGNTDQARRLTQNVLTILKPMVDKPEASEFALYQYVWTLVTTPGMGAATEAVQYAERLVKATKGTDARSLDVLARAYAASGQYGQALEAEDKAIALLPKGTNSDLRTELERNRQTFQLRAAADPPRSSAK